MSEQNPTWIADWHPEDETFWNSKGKFVARRNLTWSIVAEHIGFSVRSEERRVGKECPV
jgi:NNP family nitrate/nitrite transporter-like MFS transporter